MDPFQTWLLLSAFCLKRSRKEKKERDGGREIGTDLSPWSLVEASHQLGLTNPNTVNNFQGLFFLLQRKTAIS